MLTKLAMQSRTYLRLAQIRQCGLQLVTPAQRMIHARGYNNMEDNHAYIFHEVNMALMNAKNP